MRIFQSIASSLLLIGILVYFFLPIGTHRIEKSEVTLALNNCRQIQLAIIEYSKAHDLESASLSRLLEESIIDEKFFKRLSDANIAYFIYLRPDMESEDILVEALFSKGQVVVTFGGDGKFIPSRNIRK